MDYAIRIAEIEASQSHSEERIVGLFRYDGDPAGRRQPSLAILADIASPLYVYEQLLDTVNEAAEHTRRLMAGVEGDPMARFEKLIERLNEAVAGFVEREPTPIAWSRVNLFVIEMSENMVCVTGIGRLSSIFLQKQNDGGFKSFDLFGSLDMPATVDPKKAFACLLCGDFKPGDVLFTGTNNFERLRGELDLVNRLKTLPPVTAVLEIGQDLQRLAVPDDFAGMVASLVPAAQRLSFDAAEAIPTNKSTNSIEQLRGAEKATEEILSPSIAPRPVVKKPLQDTAKDWMKSLRDRLPGMEKNDPVSLTSMRGMSAGHGSVFTTERKRLLAGLSVILVLILAGGIWWKHNEDFKKDQQLWNTVFDQAADAKNRAEGNLQFGNESTVQQLVKQSRDLANGLDEKTEDRKKAKENLLKELDDLATQIKREVTVTPVELASASLGAPDNTLSAVSFYKNKVYAVDNSGGNLLETDPATKETKRYKLPDGTAAIVSANAGSSALYLMTANKTLLSFNNGTFGAMSWNGKATSSQALVVYGRRFYVLDPTANMVWRYEPGGGGITQETAYLKQNTSSLTDAIGLAIDSTVYVAWKNGDVKQYLSGTEQTWSLNPADPPVTSAASIWTVSDTTDRIVLADPDGKRVLVYRKDGKLVAQLKSSSWQKPVSVTGDAATKKLYVIDSNKVWQVDLP